MSRCQLVYTFADAIAVSRALYGRGIGDIVYDDVACTGNEENISDCRNRGLLSHNCQHSEDAGVLCKREKGRGMLQVVLYLYIEGTDAKYCGLEKQTRFFVCLYIGLSVHWSLPYQTMMVGRHATCSYLIDHT